MSSPADLHLLLLTGPDHPGHLPRLTTALARHTIPLLDVSQSVIHGTLLLGMVVRLPPESPLRAELPALAEELGLSLRLEPVEAAHYSAWGEEEAAGSYLLSLLARQITPAQIAEVSALLAAQGLRVQGMHRLSAHLPHLEAEPPRRACLEWSIRGEPADEAALRAALVELTHQLPLDLAWQRDTVYRRMRRLVVFDMDSTLIRQEVIDQLALEAGVGEKVIRITESAMRGEIDFDESLRQRVSLLRGLETSRMQAIADRLELTEGAETLLRALKRFGFKTAILSGGFAFFGRQIQERLGIDYLYTNDLEEAEGRLTGEVRGPIVNAQRKADLLRELAARESISLEQTIAVGDGANDLPMLATAGLGVAFHAKPLVAASAKYSIRSLGLDSLLYLLGVRDRDLEA